MEKEVFAFVFVSPYLFPPPPIFLKMMLMCLKSNNKRCSGDTRRSSGS